FSCSAACPSSSMSTWPRAAPARAFSMVLPWGMRSPISSSAGTRGSRSTPSRPAASLAFANSFRCAALPAGRSPLLRRPALRLGAGTAPQHRAFTVDQEVGLAEGLDGLLVVDDCEGASPVGAPQAAFEPPRVEHAGDGIPDVREGIGLAGKRAGAADLDHGVPALGEVQHLRQIGPGQ